LFCWRFSPACLFLLPLGAFYVLPVTFLCCGCLLGYVGNVSFCWMRVTGPYHDSRLLGMYILPLLPNYCI
jgi:hypothetical protein